MPPRPLRDMSVWTNGDRGQLMMELLLSSSCNNQENTHKTQDNNNLLLELESQIKVN